MKTNKSFNTPVKKVFFLLFVLFACLQVMATTYTVNSISDANTGSGTSGTLRYCITQANANTSVPHAINFNISGSGLQTITLGSALPVITRQVTINGYTQPGASQGTISARTLTLRIVTTSSIADIFDIQASNTVICGISFSIFGNGNLIASGAAQGATVSGLHFWGNYVNTAADGNSTTGSGYAFACYGKTTAGGVSNLQSWIIGTNGDGTNDANEGNLISHPTQASGYGNVEPLRFFFADNFIIAGNIFGLQKDGVTPLQTFAASGALNYGISISDCIGFRIGTDGNNTSDALERNVLTGMRSSAIVIFGNVSGGTFYNDGLTTDVNRANGNHSIAGNYIGTDITGIATGADLKNGTGIALRGTTYNSIGSATNAAMVNVIVNSNSHGITITGEKFYSTSPYPAIYNTIAGNYIGILSNGTTASGNGGTGVYINTGNNLSSGEISATNNTISKNIIANNASRGINVRPSTSGSLVYDNTITQNSIYANAGLGINIGSSSGDIAVTPNDGALSTPGSANANRLMDYGIVTGAALAGTNLLVKGYIGNNSAGNTTFANAVVEFFIADNSPADQNGAIISGDGLSVAHGEGKTYLGSLTADANGLFSGTLNVSGKGVVAGTTQITNTATEYTATGSTSEFSNNTTVTEAGYIYVHKKTLDESSSTDFAFSVSGGSTTVPNFSLNDNPTQVTLRDIGSSQNGRLWAVSSNNILYYRDMGSATWTVTSITNAVNVDGGANSICYVQTTGGGLISFDGTTSTTLYTGTTVADVASTWDNRPYIIANGYSLYRYSGSGSGTAGSAAWPQVGTSNDNLYLDADPSTGNVVVSKTTYNVSVITSAGVETSLGRPSGAAASVSAGDVGVDASGNIYAIYANTANVGYVFKWTGGTTWSAAEATSRSAGALTGGTGKQVWMVMSGSVAPFGNIFSRSSDGATTWWIDDERVRTSPTNSNSEMVAVVPGTYTITETVPANWDLQSITLYDPSSNSSNNVVGNTATLTVSTGETVHAVFTNGAVNPFTMTNSCANAYTDDFGSGTAGSYGSALTGQTSYHYMNTSTATREGYYKISGNANVLFGGAASLNDHTSGNGTGYMMIVDAGYDLNDFFRRRFNGLVIGATYNFSAWIANINTGGSIKPNVTFKVVDPTNYNTLATNTTGNITTSGWQQYTLSFTATATSIDLILSNNAIGGSGNDLALDDISFSLVPPQTTITTTITNNGSGGCYTSGNIQVTNPVGSSYEYSLDGTSYQSSVNFNTLSPAFYTVYARFVGTTGCVITKPDTIRAYVCGNVYDDANGLKDLPTGIVNGTGTNAGGVLKAVLYDNTAGKVSAITTVASDGTYSLGALPGYNSTVYLTNSTATLWQTAIPAASLPAGWANTGENIGPGAGNDGTVNGILPLGAVSTTVTSANFGIDQKPSATSFNYTLDPVPTRGGTYPIDGSYRNMFPLDGDDPEQGSMGTGATFVITGLGNMDGNILSYNGVQISGPATIANYNPALLTITFNQSGNSGFAFNY
ncbi:beta strand repeat-containing protein, partial [Foetidibacter luteolus]|uniref:beta strand repeat-containing protein n=1 Tax=Foetidibacter luteolus TaxID=2608880 RepID=UPI001A98ED57